MSFFKYILKRSLSENFGYVTSSMTYSLSALPFDSQSLNTSIWLRGRLQKSRIKGSIGFLILRQQIHSIQCCVFKSALISKSDLKFIENIPDESIIDVYGTVQATSAPTSCSISNLEINIQKLYLISKSHEILPFTYEEGLEKERVSLKVRLDNRQMDLRMPINQCLFRVSDKICESFRGFLKKQGFLEIHTPKIIAGVSEGGSDVFHLDYFGNKACLAQSPQLFKQMAVLGDLQKVFEIAPVFRAENSNTHRHLCEFVGLDLEMCIKHSYHEIIQVLHNLLCYIFDEIDSLEEMKFIRNYFGTEKILKQREILLITFEDSVKLLSENGVSQDLFQDFSTENEKMLGKIIKEKYNTDLFVVHKYPTKIRPFYTMPCVESPDFSCSFDIFLRGEEIASGSQRIHEFEKLKSSAEERGINLDSIQSYLESFKYGAFPHAGCGFGLERILMLFAGTNNIRFSSLFPRDPKRLMP